MKSGLQWNWSLVDSSKFKGLTYLPIALGIFCCVSMIVWYLSFCYHGIEFSDEGFNINWIKQPWNYSFSLTQFGFVYHPIFVLLSGNVGLLRMFNVLCSFFLALILVKLVLDSYFVKSLDRPWSGRLISLFFQITLALPFVTSFGSLNLTPGYNSLTLQGLLTALISLVLINRRQSRGIFSWVLLGISGLITFLGKPTSAAGLAVTVIVFLWASKLFCVRGLFISLLTATLLLLSFAFIIDGSLPRFFNRYFESYQAMKMMGGHTAPVLRLDHPSLSKNKMSWMFASFLLNFFFLWFMQSKFILRGLFWFLVSGLYFIFSILILSIALFKYSIGHQLFQMTQVSIDWFPIIFLSLPASCFFFLFICQKNNRSSDLFRQRIVFSGLLILTPFLLAMGTNRNYWINAGWALGTWILAGLVISAPRINHWKDLLGIGFSVQFITFVLLGKSLYEPFRQKSPLVHQITRYEWGKEKQHLYLDKEVVEYLNSLRTIGIQNGFHRESPILDITGASPSTIFLIDGIAIGGPWIIGGYPGSENVFIFALKRIPCSTLKESWVLAEIEGPRSIKKGTLKELGMDLALAVVDKFSVIRPVGVSGFNSSGTQSFFKPDWSQVISKGFCLQDNGR